MTKNMQLARMSKKDIKRNPNTFSKADINDIGDLVKAEGNMFINASLLVSYIETRQAYGEWDQEDKKAVMNALTACKMLIVNMKRVGKHRDKVLGEKLDFSVVGQQQLESLDKSLSRLISANESQLDLFDVASDLILSGYLPMFLHFKHFDLQEISKSSNYSVETIKEVLTHVSKFCDTKR